MSDSGVAGQSSGINRKAAAIFQQQSAGLTGLPSILNLPLALVPSTVAPLSAIRAPPDVMVTPVALPPADTARVPPSSTRVFQAEWPSSTSRRPPDSRTTPSALAFSTVKFPRRLLPRTLLQYW
ncbi:hypothetical protein ECP03052937_3332 [Escherichia coli p0305293.7]|nr:hypothetical protein ECP03052937_3332 [Escherichia coli p0305293.7]